MPRGAAAADDPPSTGRVFGQPMIYWGWLARRRPADLDILRPRALIDRLDHPDDWPSPLSATTVTASGGDGPRIACTAAMPPRLVAYPQTAAYPHRVPASSVVGPGRDKELSCDPEHGGGQRIGPANFVRRTSLAARRRAR